MNIALLGIGIVILLFLGVILKGQMVIAKNQVLIARNHIKIYALLDDIVKKIKK